MSVIWSGVTEDGAVVPVQVTAEGKVVAVGDGPEGEFLKLSGGNLTGDLSIGTDKINLKTDGSITAAGDNITVTASGNYFTSGSVYAGTDPSLGSAPGSGLSPGKVMGTDSGSSAVWEGRNTNTGLAITSSIKADGSARFSSGGCTIANNGQVEVRRDGNLYQGRNLDGTYVFTVEQSGTVKLGNTRAIILSGRGFADFAGGACGFTETGELFFTSRGERYKLVVAGGLCTPEPFTRQMELKEKAEAFLAGKKEIKPSEPGVTPDNDIA